MALSVASARDSDGDAAASGAAEAAARALSAAATPHPAQRFSALSSLHGAAPPGSAGRTAALRGALAVAKGAVAESPAAAISSGAAALSAAARAHGEAWATADAGGDESIKAELLLALAEAVRSGAPGKKAAARDAAKLAGAAMSGEGGASSSSSSPSPAVAALAGAAAERAVADFLSSPDAASFDLASAPAVKALSSSKSASGKALAASLESVLKGDTKAAAAACEGAGAAALASVGVSRAHVENKARLLALLKAAEAAPGGVLTFEAVEKALALPAGGAARALVAAGGASVGAAVVRIDGKAKTAHVARRAPLYPSSPVDYATLAAGLKRWAESGRAVVEKLKAQAVAEATGREA